MATKDKFHLVKIYADAPHEWNCSEWRDLAVADAINKSATDGVHPDWSAKLVHVSGFMDYLNPAIQEIMRKADIITVQRNLIAEDVFTSIRYWKGLGKVVLADLDDAYHILPFSNPAFQFWKENVYNLDPTPLAMLERGLSYCDGLTCPNRLLYGDWSHVVKGYYLQNFARREWWTGLPEKNQLKESLGIPLDKIVIGWGGSVSHYDSWHGSGLFEAATNIVRHNPNVLFAICGNDPRIYDHLPVHKDYKKQIPGVPPGEWPKIVSSFDIGVAPLYGPYDQRRSWIKSLEYGLAGIPWIATAGEPYRDHAAFGALIENSAENWESAIEECIRLLPEAQVIARDRVSVFQQWFVDQQLDNIIALYRTIMNDHRVDSGQLPNLVFIDGKG